MAETAPFVFHTERRLIRLTGRKARNLRELADHLREVSGSSVFYHTHHQYLTHHFERPRFYNDFALWAGRALLEYALAERLAAIDLFSYTSVRDLREALLEIIEGRVVTREAERVCPPGDEFHFCESQSFVMPTGLVAHTVPELFEMISRATSLSVFFHLMEARLRLGRTTSDFAVWLRDMGDPALAKAIDAVNPYVLTMDELRQKVVRLGRRRRAARKAVVSA